MAFQRASESLVAAKSVAIWEPDQELCSFCSFCSSGQNCDREGGVLSVRQTLPNRRRCQTLDFEHGGHRFSLTFSSYPDGRPAEIFLSSRHIGSSLEACSVPLSMQSRRPADEHLCIDNRLAVPRARTTSIEGKLYVTATIKAKDGDTFQFWRVAAFSDSAQAELKAEIYGKNGETKLSLSLVADHVLALRQPPKPREPGSRTASAPPAPIGTSMTRSPIDAAMSDEWHSPGLEEQAWLTRRALHVMKELLSSQRPLWDDQERDLQLRVAQSAIANARRAKTVLARFGGLMPLDGVLQEIAALGTVH